MITNPPHHPDLFAPILCEHCTTEAAYLIHTGRTEHVCGVCLDIIAAHHDWTEAAA